MNGLSWIFYLADVSGAIDWVAIAVTIFGIIVIGLTAFVTCGMTVFATSKGEEQDAKSMRIWLGKVCVFSIPIIIGAFLLQAVLPERQTFMLIASSEIGETILNTDKAQQIGGETGELVTDTLKMLRKYVNEQLGEAPKAEEPTK